MWIHSHPYLFIYLIGCILVVILTLIKISLFWTIAWITKGNILNKNLKKLLSPNKGTFIKKVTQFLGVLLLETALSWINVVVVLWQITTALLRTVREVFSSTPEAIKLLRFPLKTNPDMSREAVWAYVQALQVKGGGKQLSESELLATLNELFDQFPSFDRRDALKQLESLNVMSSGVISATLSRLSPSEEEI